MAVIREKRNFQVGPIGVARASRGGEIVGEAISNSANALAQTFFQEAERNAQQFGEEAGMGADRSAVITINPATGEPEAYAPPSGFGTAAANAYQRVVMRRFQQSIDDEMRIASQEIAVKFENDPNSTALYETAMSNYIAQMSNAAEGAFKGYINDVGTTYLQATRTNLAINQIRRERSAAAKAQETAITQGLNDIEMIVSQTGPASLSEAGVGSALLSSVSVSMRDGAEAGLFDSSMTSRMTAEGRAATARGLLRYAANNTNDPDALELLQHAIGTQNPSAVPAGYEYVADALRSLGSDYGQLAELEKFSDGLFSDRVQYANTLRAQETAEKARLEAVSIFDMRQELPASLAFSRSLATNPNFSASTIATEEFKRFNAATAAARNFTLNGQTDLANEAISQRDSLLEATTEGLELRALVNLSRNETLQLEAAIAARNPALAPESSREALQALITIDSTVNAKTLSDFLPAIGSYRDGAGKFVELEQSSAAASEAAMLEGDIANLSLARADAVTASIADLSSKIGSIENLDESLRASYLKEINFRGAQARVSEFFDGLPSDASIKEGAAYLSGAGAGADLRDDQRAILDEARSLAIQSGKESELRTHFNVNSSVASDRAARRDALIERNRNIEMIQSGSGVPTLKEHRTLTEELLEQRFAPELNGRSLASLWNDPQSLTNPDLQPVLQTVANLHVMPESLHRSLTAMAHGGFIGSNPSVLLSHYSNLREYSYNGVEMNNPMMRALSQEEIATLDYIADAAPVLGSSPDAIANMMRLRSENESNPQFKQRVETFFDGSIDQFVNNLDGIGDAPPSSINALSAAALALYSTGASMGISRAQIKDRLERQIERTYPDGDSIVFGANGSARTRAPLSYAAPGNEDLFKEYIIERVTEADSSGLPVRFIRRQGSMAEPRALTAYLLSQAVGIEGDVDGRIFLKPVGISTPDETRYQVFRMAPLEQGGPQPIYENIEEVGADGQTQTYSAPLIISSRDQRFLDKTSSRSAKESDAARSTAIRMFNTPTSIPSIDSLAGPELMGGGIFSLESNGMILE